MDGLEREKKEEKELLNLSLSIVSHSYDTTDGIRNTRRRKNSDKDSSTSRGSYDGGDHNDHHRQHHHQHNHDQAEILALLQHREQMLIRKDNPNSSTSGEETIHRDPELINLLLKIGTSFDEYSLSSAASDLIKIYQNTSLTGDSLQRVTAYFTDGLIAAKLLKDKSSSLFYYNMIMKQPSSGEEFMAFTHLYKVSPCYQFSHFTANQAILEAFEREQETNNWGLHVLDFDLAYGFQWPSLLQSLSEKATTANTLIYLHITGYARSIEELVETEARLVSFSKAFSNIVFEFQGLLRGSNDLVHNVVKRKDNETLAVSLVSRNYSFITCDMLKSIRYLHPSIVVLVKQGSHAHDFADSLRYYTAMFDSLDNCLPRDNLERLCIERDQLGKEIKNLVVGCFRDEQKMSERLSMEDHGFYGIKLSSRTVMQAKLLLRMRNHNPPWLQNECSGGFRVSESEDGKSISLAWKDTPLITASVWQSV